MNGCFRVGGMVNGGDGQSPSTDPFKFNRPVPRTTYDTRGLSSFPFMPKYNSYACANFVNTLFPCSTCSGRIQQNKSCPICNAGPDPAFWISSEAEVCGQTTSSHISSCSGRADIINNRMATKPSDPPEPRG